MIQEKAYRFLRKVGPLVLQIFLSSLNSTTYKSNKHSFITKETSCNLKSLRTGQNSRNLRLSPFLHSHLRIRRKISNAGPRSLVQNRPTPGTQACHKENSQRKILMLMVKATALRSLKTLFKNLACLLKKVALVRSLSP